MFVNGIEGVITGISVSYGDDDEILVKEGTQMDVEKITLSDFNEKLIEIFDTADSMREYNKVRDNIRKSFLMILSVKMKKVLERQPSHSPLSRAQFTRAIGKNGL